MAPAQVESPFRKGEANAGLWAAELHAPWKEWRAVARRQTTEGAHPSQPAGHLFIFFLCHVIEAIIPANLQTEHFVNLHREQIQQSRVTPFKKGSVTNLPAFTFPLVQLFCLGHLLREE